MTFTQNEKLMIEAALEELKLAKDQSFFCRMPPEKINPTCDSCIQKLHQEDAHVFKDDEYRVMYGALGKVRLTLQPSGVYPVGFLELHDKLRSIAHEMDD